jgi:membrane-bound ClpP family serine protease
MVQLLQLFGAVLILVPFAWSQLGALSVSSARYLGLNLVGSALLAAAVIEVQWGFLLLEGCWALVAGWRLLERSVGRGAGQA